jgi:hypothetical protein
MSTTRSRLILAAIVAGTALLSAGATAYAVENGHSAEAGATENVSQMRPTSSPSAPTPAPTSPTVQTPAPAPTAPAEPAEREVVEVMPPTTGTDASTDDNVVEVRVPNPDAIPTTPAEYEYFYGLITQCMAEAGFEWHGVWLSADDTFAGVSMTRAGDISPELQAGFTLALHGDTGAGDHYHWADAGCWGYAVHVSGNDGNN